MHPTTKQVEAKELASTIEELLSLDGATVDQMFEDTEAGRQLFSDVSECCERAYRLNDAQSLFWVHRILYQIYKLHFEIPPPGAASAESSIILAGLRNLIEKHFLAYEESLIPAHVWGNVPKTAEEYKAWLLAAVHGHPAYEHPLYEDYLGTRANLDGLRNFLVQETTIDSRFDDFLALIQVGTQGGVKLEIASNYWDEMGNGEEARMHTVMFYQTMEHLKLNPNADDVFTVEALMCGNLARMFSLRRQYFYRAIGYFVVTEYLAPGRFDKVLEAWVRNGLKGSDAAYHRAHVTIDEDHADHWFRNVINAAIDKDPDAVFDITRGAFCRLNTSQRYLDTLHAKLAAHV